MPDRVRKRVPDHGSDVLKGSLPQGESCGMRSSVLEVSSDNYYPRLISWGGGGGGAHKKALRNVVTLVHFNGLRCVECFMSR